MLGDTVAFYVFAAVMVVASLLVIGQRSPIYSVLLLIASFVALAGLYVLLDAPFLAVIQIIIYAGAIMVLFLFVVMLLNAPYEQPIRGTARRPLAFSPRRIGGLLGLALLAELIWALSRGGAHQAAPVGEVGGAPSVAELGRILFADYGFAFEVTSILILIAMVGAVVLAKREI